MNGHVAAAAHDVAASEADTPMTRDPLVATACARSVTDLVHVGSASR